MKFITNRNLTIGNFVIVIYFTILYLLSIYKFDSFLIGFFGELLTIPFLLAQIVFIVIGIGHLKWNNRKNYFFIISLIALIVCSILTIGGLLKYRF